MEVPRETKWVLPHIRERAMKHSSGSMIDYPVINDLPSLLWLVNLGCVDLNQWYAKCAGVDRPDYLHFDLDPVPKAGFARVLETALLLKEALDGLKIKSDAKTTGSRGVHIYVPIVRGPLQKEVWIFAKELARLSTPVTWEEVERGFKMEDFRMENVPGRLRKVGDLFRPLQVKTGRLKLEKIMGGHPA